MLDCFYCVRFGKLCDKNNVFKGESWRGAAPLDFYILFMCELLFWILLNKFSVYDSRLWTNTFSLKGLTFNSFARRNMGTVLFMVEILWQNIYFWVPLKVFTIVVYDLIQILKYKTTLWKNTTKFIVTLLTDTESLK